MNVGSPGSGRNTVRSGSGKPDKAGQRADAERAVAEFLAKGRAIVRGPDVVPTTIVCASCGTPAVVGISPKQRRKARCPKCGAILT
jgi:hypothetical protein